MMQPEEKLRSEIKRIPVENLENIGSVSEPQDAPQLSDPFEGDDPFPMSPYQHLFEDEEKEKRQDAIARAVIKIDWKQILGEEK